jgi:hypothetical protein
MDTVVDISRTPTRTECHRYMVMEIITNELYPSENFPAKNFPNLHALLFGLFIDEIKPRKELWNDYTAGENAEQIRAEVRRILDFKNLLHNHPREVVLIYRKYIEKFIAYKYTNASDREDILQEILTRLIEDKIYKIRERFDFNFTKVTSFTSYFMVAVRNIYIDIMRERNVRPLTAGDVQEIDDVPDLKGDKTMINKLLLKEELVKLQTILILYYKSRARLELCLKLKYRIPLTRREIEKCFPNCREEDVQILTQDFSLMRDKRVFEKILAVFNYHEARENKSDTLRKWVNVKVEEIILHLNRTHDYKVYNAKNFADFIGLYYEHIGGDREFGDTA